MNKGYSVVFLCLREKQTCFTLIATTTQNIHDGLRLGTEDEPDV